MSRIIKFRAIVIDTDKWIYGGGVWTFNFADNLSKCALFGPAEDRSQPQITIVKPETVGQFTGLFDRNGKEIWESDVIKDDMGLLYEVKWADVRAGWLAFSNKHLGFGLSSGESTEYEVIGNVHQNPDLLKGGG